MHSLLNLEKFEFILKYTYLSLLRVSVFDHPQGAESKAFDSVSVCTTNSTHTPFHDILPHLHKIYNDVILLNVLTEV